MVQWNDAPQTILHLLEPGIEIRIVASIFNRVAAMSDSRAITIKSTRHTREAHAQPHMAKIHCDLTPKGLRRTPSPRREDCITTQPKGVCCQAGGKMGAVFVLQAFSFVHTTAPSL